MKQQIVSVDWLYKNQNRDNLIILDASPKLTASSKVSKHRGLTIPSARSFEIKEKFTDSESPFPNTVPSAEQFQKECRLLGINQNSELVVFDNLGIYSSPRVWWLFKVMGHDNIKVLNGGLPEWIAKGYEGVDSVEQEFDEGDFVANRKEEYILSYDDICKNIENEEYLVVDARSSGRFNGTAEEPRKTLQSGKIPHSINVPYQSLLKDDKFRPAAEIKEVFAKDTSQNQTLAFSCGSGMTACIIMLASEITGNESRYLFDGSWTEYALRKNLVKPEM